MLQVKATIPQASGLETKPKKQGKFEWITKNFLFPFPFSAPLQITAVLPNNFLHKLKCWLCLQKFLFEKTRYDLLHNYNLISQKKKGKKKKRGGKAKSSPTTSSNKSLCSYLLRNGLSIETYFMWQALLFFFFFFFGHLAPIEPSRPGVTALFWTTAMLRLPDTTQFFCVCVFVFC